MAVEKAIGSSSLVEVVDRILDKGVVVDAWVRVSLVGIEILAIEARRLSENRAYTPNKFVFKNEIDIQKVVS